MKKWMVIGLGLVVIVLSSFSWSGMFGKKIDYNVDVKPILNKSCIGCHGGVKKAGDISFLFEHEMLEPGKSGKAPVVRGDAHASEMIRRILSEDPDERMPKDAEPLPQEEVEILTRWINEGASWEKHWSYKKVESPSIPALRSLSNLFGLLNRKEVNWVKNEIDYFVLDKLKEKKLSFSPEADKATLIRRVSIDLTGLPPTEKEVADFVEDQDPKAYEKVVDRLLKSPAYGERWTSMWMDLARYADTKGYEKDGGRNIWRYRDYVLKSFNADKPFDQFTTEQLAGDLMSSKNEFPTEEKLIATGFHRNTMNNDEGGTSDEEFRVAAQIDRIGTTWEVWQGTTFACIQCHSHPYDPISHEEYFKYMAFFNNTRDEDVPSESPTLRLYKNEDSTAVQQILSWVRTHKPAQSSEFNQFLKVMEPKIQSHDFKLQGSSTFIDGKYLGLKHKTSAVLPNMTLTGKNRLVLSVGTGAENAVLTIMKDSISKTLLAKIPVPNTVGKGDTVMVVPMTALTGKHNLYFTLESAKTPDKWVQIRWVALQNAIPGKGAEGYDSIVNTYAKLLTTRVEETPVLWEGEGDLKRNTHVFVRGNWLVKGNEVQPDIPELFGGMPAGYSKDRLGLTKWMVHRDNPLTARVIVNRFWEQLFGRGIVETLEDFGSQGAEPSHPELLDWLAVAFMETDQWSVKKMLKRVVMSATYQQTSKSDRARMEKDPANEWLSRGPRVRLSAEQVRDQALAVSGLLSSKMYGPSVMPPQPEGIWLSPYSGESWVLSEGEDKHRRAVYTYWKRTAPYPSMVTFDAPSREFCQSRRIRTNTPLQALVTLNDPVYLEAAEHLALEMKKRGKEPKKQLSEGYRLLTFQSIQDKNLDILLKIYREALTEYQKNPAEIDRILIYGKEKSPELAALTVSANVLLNLDQVVTRE